MKGASNAEQTHRRKSVEKNTGLDCKNSHSYTKADQRNRYTSLPNKQRIRSSKNGGTKGAEKIKNTKNGTKGQYY